MTTTPALRRWLTASLFAALTAACGSTPPATTNTSTTTGSHTTGATASSSTGSSSSGATSTGPSTTTASATASDTSGASTTGTGSSGPSTTGTSASSTGTTGANTTSGTSGTSGSCPGYADPNTAASCPCASGQTCTANGCYGGWYCDLSTNRCVSPPSSCVGTGSTTGSSTTTGGGSGGACAVCTGNADCASNSCSGGTSSTTSSGTTTGTTGSGTTSGTSGTSGTSWTGSVTAQGGTVNKLFFAAVGDSRPPNEDDTTNYPTAIISHIYQDIQQVNPEFVVATGDYQFANPSGTQGAAQVGMYVQARQAYSGVVFPAMGNHECNGYTAGNCTSTSQSNNYAAFMQQMVQPIGQTKPYYRFDVNDSAGQWTAKFIVLAMNAWDSTQASWLQTQLAQTTTYTFIIRHEPSSANTAPGVTPSDNIISQYPYTLYIVGHTHEFSHSSSREVIVGNGGAPISYGNYGYATFQMTANGDIQVSNYDYSSNAATTTFTVPK